jgi:hypothetical protein
MSEALTVIQQTAIQPAQGGQGVDFSNPLFNLKPATLSIVQPNSQVDGGIKGSLRIANTGDQYKEMWCTLLVMPTQKRDYYIGNPGELNRTPDNLMCFSTDMVNPSPKAKVPQAINCANCPRADWGPWREYKEKNNGQTNKALIPQCDAHYVALFIDTNYKLPLKMYIRSKAKETFEFGMENLARTLYIGKAEGKNPNIYDVKFKLSTKMIQIGKYQTYVPVFSDFTYITEEEKASFGAVYQSYLISKQKPTQEEEAAKEQAQSDAPVELVEGQYEDGEITV